MYFRTATLYILANLLVTSCLRHLSIYLVLIASLPRNKRIINILFMRVVRDRPDIRILVLEKGNDGRYYTWHISEVDLNLHAFNRKFVSK